MAVATDVAEISNSGGLQEDYTRRYTRTWRVVTDVAVADVLIATATALLPAKGAAYVTTYSADLGATLREYEGERSPDDNRVWLITATYSSAPAPIRSSTDPSVRAGGPAGSSARGSETERNPLLRPPEVRFGEQKFQEPYALDVNGKLVASAAKEPLSPKPTRDKTYLTMTIQVNRQGYDPRSHLEFFDTINNSTWKVCGFTFDPRTVKCESIVGDSRYEEPFFYWQVTYRFTIRGERVWDQYTDENPPGVPDSGWYDYLENEGTQVLDVNGRPHDIQYPANSSRIGHPVALSVNGMRSAHGPGPGVGGGPLRLDTIPSEANYRVFVPYKSRNFNLLGLPRVL